MHSEPTHIQLGQTMCLERKPICSVVVGNNSHLIRDVSELYIPDGAVVADVTYGLGVFWRRTDTSRFWLRPTDLLTVPEEDRHDFRNLPYAAGSIDIVVIDPPYQHHPNEHQVTNDRYNNFATTEKMNHRDILRLYYDGMVEAKRVLKPKGGLLFVKCKDEIESSWQCWSHIELYEYGVELGLYARDLFVLVPTSRMISARWARQLHARKNHSYLWVFETGKKPKRSRSHSTCSHPPSSEVSNAMSSKESAPLSLPGRGTTAAPSVHHEDADQRAPENP
jgi:hypothetical protein